MTSFINEMKAFWDLAEVEELPMSECRLWQVLFLLHNRLGWPETVSVSNKVLAAKTTLPVRTLTHARKRLVERGLITVKSKGLGHAPVYTLHSLVREGAASPDIDETRPIAECVAAPVATRVAQGVAPPLAQSVAVPIATPVADGVATLIRQTRQTNQTKTEDGIRRARGAAFTPPSFEDIKAYCLERQNSVNPDKWLSYYQANGWKVGRNPMRDWRAAVRTWEMNDRAAVGNAIAPRTGLADEYVDTDGAWC